MNGETPDNAREKADRTFVSLLEEIDPELAKEERERQAQWRELMSKPAFTVRPDPNAA